MSYILPYKIFEEVLFSDKVIINKKSDNQEFLKMINDFDSQNIDTDPIKYVKISEDKDNEHDFKYNNTIKIIYNDNKEHPLFTKKRFFERTGLPSLSAFNIIFKNIINVVYPKYLFDDFNNIDIENEISKQKYKLTRAFNIYNSVTGKYTTIPFTLSAKYNKLTKKYDFFIYVLTITFSTDDSKTYQIFNLENDSNDIEIISVEFIGKKPYIPNDILLQINELKKQEKKDLENSDKPLLIKKPDKLTLVKKPDDKDIKKSDVTNNKPKNIMSSKDFFKKTKKK